MFKSADLNPIRYLVILFAAITALIHIGLGLASGGAFLLIFLLNGLGFLGLVAGLYFVPQLADKANLIRLALILYSLVTIILYFVMNDSYNLIGYLTKAVELALIGFVVIDMNQPKAA